MSHIPVYSRMHSVIYIQVLLIWYLSWILCTSSDKNRVLHLTTSGTGQCKTTLIAASLSLIKAFKKKNF